MFGKSHKIKRQAASDALSVNKDQVKTELAKLTDVAKRLEDTVNETSSSSKAMVRRLKKRPLQI